MGIQLDAIVLNGGIATPGSRRGSSGSRSARPTTGSRGDVARLFAASAPLDQIAEAAARHGVKLA